MQYRNLPNVNSILENDAVQEIVSLYKRDWVVELVRETIDQARETISKGHACPTLPEIISTIKDRVALLTVQSPRRVINATGVIIHTNLGRSPLSDNAMEAALAASAGYSDLEFDLSSGRRGSRQSHLQSLLKEITGAEASLVVNNNASALLLGLSALADGKEVIVSRGEAVEIGGGFRVPDVMEQSGAVLIDVGTTNRTYVRDYANSLTPQTGVFLKAHASNFRVEGFTAEVSIGELVELGRVNDIPVIHDVGSGALLDTDKYGLAHEPTPQESISAGAGLVMFSGDKLLGGPQAGIISGDRALVEKLSRHPLARAIRIDKISLASLTATLMHYLKGEAEAKIPIWKMISAHPDQIRLRAQKWKESLQVDAEIIESKSAVGGGSLPGETLNSWSLAIDSAGVLGGAQALVTRLRENVPPIIARIEGDKVLLDPRTVMENEEDLVVDALRRCVI
ncbi:MAG: L-seryl-tRNA(Sec) selenium transferase [Dehalococcoidia bacterium]|nr:L-seryl-tRNA(Sec) selenium transferase [Dehalococcoidia bacterium]